MENKIRMTYEHFSTLTQENLSLFHTDLCDDSKEDCDYDTDPDVPSGYGDGKQTHLKLS